MAGAGQEEEKVEHEGEEMVAGRQQGSSRGAVEQCGGQAQPAVTAPCSSKTKELIAEIELLEEEIANREQHVLTLYRSIFDQCMSGPPSGQSSGISSPAHAKTITARTRRQPSIISSAFCSSKKLPLQPFHITESLSESGRTKNTLKAKIKHPSFSSETLDSSHSTSFPPDPKKLPYSGSGGSLARTLKDHLYQCPSKISEEMVRCMASIYYLLRTEAPAGKPEKARSPFLSRSSTNVILPRRVNGEENSAPNNRCTVEIASISVDKNQMPDVSYAITHYRLLVEQLERVDLSVSENSAYLAYGIPNSSLKRMALFHKAAYNIGGHAITANAIEHALLCFRSPRIGRWFESILSTAMRKKCPDEKQLVQLKFGLQECQPLALFALCTGASSDPMLRVYTAKNVMEELERAKREFLQATVVVRKSTKKLFLPRLVERYAREACVGPDSVLPWAQREGAVAVVDDRPQQEAAQRGVGSRRKAVQAVEWLPYATRFRYAFARSMVDKPHC
uniref:Electron transporter n=1 Tax=Zea mays TaxID=4577 RepID=A0A804LN65_MAIZE